MSVFPLPVSEHHFDNACVNPLLSIIHVMNFITTIDTVQVLNVLVCIIFISRQSVLTSHVVYCFIVMAFTIFPTVSHVTVSHFISHFNHTFSNYCFRCSKTFTDLVQEVASIKRKFGHLFCCQIVSVNFCRFVIRIRFE